MTPPGSTYRVQFNPGFRFVDGRDLVPYLSELGVTDLYSSPRYQGAPRQLAWLRYRQSAARESRTGNRRRLRRDGREAAPLWHGAAAGHRAQPHGGEL